MARSWMSVQMAWISALYNKEFMVLEVERGKYMHLYNL